jgi:hypothetical protein
MSGSPPEDPDTPVPATKESISTSSSDNNISSDSSDCCDSSCFSESKNASKPPQPPSRSVGWFPPHYSVSVCISILLLSLSVSFSFCLSVSVVCAPHVLLISTLQALMNGSDIYQQNERNRREYNKIRAIDMAKTEKENSNSKHPANNINIPFFIGMGLGLGLNIVGYFAFKAYFRSFLDAMTFRPRSGVPFGIDRSDVASMNRYRKQRQQQYQQYYQHKQQQSSSTSESPHTSSRSKHRSRASSSSSSSSHVKKQDDRSSIIKQHLLSLDMPLSPSHPSIADIKRAYRLISLKTHPDVANSRSRNTPTSSQSGSGGSSERQRKELELRFVRATTAYNELLRRLHGK